MLNKYLGAKYLEVKYKKQKYDLRLLEVRLVLLGCFMHLGGNSVPRQYVKNYV